jgi:hypothetical protein
MAKPEHKTFRKWLLATLDENQLADLASHGADTGWPGLTYTSDAVELFDTYGDEIWEMAVEASEQYGMKNVAEFIAGFQRADMMGSLDTFKNLMVWFAAEAIAQEVTGEE